MLIVNENTYITVEEADELIRTHLDEYDGFRLFWGVLKEADKEVYLTKSIEELEALIIPGRKTKVGQVLNFPRYPMQDVPKDIKLAQMYNALGLFNADIKGAVAESLDLFKRFGVHLGTRETLEGTIFNDGKSGEQPLLSSTRATRIMNKYRRGGFRMR